MSEWLIPTGVTEGDLDSGRISRRLGLGGTLDTGDELPFPSSADTYSQQDMPMYRRVQFPQTGLFSSHFVTWLASHEWGYKTSYFNLTGFAVLAALQVVS